MKAVTAMCPSGASVSPVANGRVSRPRDGENAEIQMYISKLKTLVPFMPKNRKISKLEVIQNVIYYICDLQKALESNPAVNNFDPTPITGVQGSQPASPRQPLGVRTSPNTILQPSSPGESNVLTVRENFIYNRIDILEL